MKTQVAIIRTLIPSLFFFFGILSIDAQEVFSVGPRVGLNIANVSNVSDSKAKVGFVGGVTGTYSLSESTGLTMDILYSQEGYQTDGGSDFSLNYLQIPLYFDLFFGRLGERFRPKVYAGVAPGFLLSADRDGTDISDISNKVVFSLTGGLGFNYRIADRVWLNVDGRSFLGLSDITREEFQVGDKNAARNIQLSAGVAFGLSRLDQ